MPTADVLRVTIQDVKDVLRAPRHIAGPVVLMRGQDSPPNKCLDVAVLVLGNTRDVPGLCCGDNGVSQEAVGGPASAGIAAQPVQSLVPSGAHRS